MSPDAAPNHARDVMHAGDIQLAQDGLYQLRLVLEHARVHEGQIVTAIRTVQAPLGLGDTFVAVRLLANQAQVAQVSMVRGFKGYVWTNDDGAPVWRPDIMEA